MLRVPQLLARRAGPPEEVARGAVAGGVAGELRREYLLLRVRRRADEGELRRLVCGRRRAGRRSRRGGGFVAPLEEVAERHF
jgi:hypothetical protein